MYVASYIAAVILSLVLERQERRHAFERNREYRRLGLAEPEHRPRIPRIESWFNVWLGVLLVCAASFMGYATYEAMIALRGRPGVIVASPAMVEFLSVVLAVGVALLVLGMRAVRIWNRYEASMAVPAVQREEAGAIPRAIPAHGSYRFRPGLVLATLLGTFLVGMAVEYFLLGPRQTRTPLPEGPFLAVVRIDQGDADPFLDALAKKMTTQLVADLKSVPDLRAVPWGGSLPPDAAFVLQGTIGKEGETISIRWEVRRTADASIVVARSYRYDPDVSSGAGNAVARNAGAALRIEVARTEAERMLNLSLRNLD